jgi:predicted dehydrogenase
MIDACRSNNVLFMEGLMYRFHPQFHCVRQWLDEGPIGPLRLIRISFSFPLEARHSRIRLQSAMCGGALADVGIYGIDLSRWLIGSVPGRVFAFGGHGFGADVETCFAALLSYENGASAVLDGGFDRPGQNRCEIVGESGVITIASPFLGGDNTKVRLKTRDQDGERAFPFFDPFQAQFQHFPACALDRTKPLITAAETLANARALAALRASLDGGAPVDPAASARGRTPAGPRIDMEKA